MTIKMTNEQVEVLKTAMVQHFTNCNKFYQWFSELGPDLSSQDVLAKIRQLDDEISDIYDIANGFNKANAIVAGVKLY